MTITVQMNYGGEEIVSRSVALSPQALDTVLFDFNVTKDPNVTDVKALHAALIQKMRDLQSNGTSPQKRAAAIAITELEGTQMRAVKAYFAKA